MEHNYCELTIFIEHSRTTFQFHSNFRRMYVQHYLVFLSHKNINSEIAVSQSVYCLTRKDDNDVRYSKLF